MKSYSLIVPVLLGLSICVTSLPARAQDTRCIGMRPYHAVPQSFAAVMRNMARTDIDIDDAPVRIEPRLAGLKGPSVTLLGRDVRIAMETAQSSPQEMWHKARWDGGENVNGHAQAHIPCPDPHRRAGFFGIRSLLKYSTYTNIAVEHDMGGMVYEPFILYRSRVVADAMILRPYGLIIGAGVSMPVAGNTYNLLYAPDPRAPVRRDMALFDNTVAVPRLYGAWQGTVAPHTHMAVTGGYIEDMYAGVGAEIIYRPFPSLFWAGADVWGVWRRDARSTMNMKLRDAHIITGHVRAGYDFAHMNTSVYGAVGRYLAEDFGASIGVTHAFENGLKLDARMTWSERGENDAVFAYTKLEPSLRVEWPLGNTYARHTRSVRTHFRQMGRDSGQMIMRPRPLEDVTMPFSARAIAGEWPDMFVRKKEAAQTTGGL